MLQVCISFLRLKNRMRLSLAATTFTIRVPFGSMVYVSAKICPHWTWSKILLFPQEMATELRQWPVQIKLGLEHAAVTALKNSGKFLPWQVATISVDGTILRCP